jgi:chromosome segregation protein
MISRLKSLELQGYKTFANRTVFEFPGAVTAIVGPNGSGKSNITDALRWVLGEQSYSLLRGKKTEDMIFSGSDRRTRSGMATATVILDNSDNWLPIDFTEVAIARRAYRDGSNEYLLNGQRVRLRDVSELLSESGLAERTYTIIGQGLVDAALALRAEDRRRLFEEAAGIGLHRSRRQEAVRRLADTQRNLERVEDILIELRPRLRSLKRQAHRAEEYDRAVAELRTLLREWYGYHWHLAQEELAQAQTRVNDQSAVLEEIRHKESETEGEINLLRGKRQKIRDELNNYHNQSADLHKRRENASRELAVAEERARYFQEQEDRFKIDLSQSDEEVGLLEERNKFALEEVDRLQSELEEAEAKSKSVNSAYELQQRKRQDIEAKLAEDRELLVKLSTQRLQLTSRNAERQAQLENLKNSMISAKKSIEESKGRGHLVEGKVESRVKDLEVAERALREIEVSSEAIKGKIIELNKFHQELDKRLATLETEISKYTAQYEVIKDAEQSYAGYSSGAKILLGAIKEAKLKESKGILGSNLSVPEKFEIAIGAVLGEYIDALILDSQADIEHVLSILEQRSGKAALLPLDTILVDEASLDYINEGGIFGLASDLISAPEALQPVLDLLTRNALIVEDRKLAQKVVNNLRNNTNNKVLFLETRVVTLAGEVFFVYGPVKTNSNAKPVSLSRQREGREIQQKLSQAKEKQEVTRQKMSQVETNLSELQTEKNRVEQTYADQLKVRDNAIDAHRHILLEYEQLKRELEWQEDQLSRYRIAVEEVQNKIQVTNGTVQELKQRESENEERINHHIEELQDFPTDDLRAELTHWRTRIAVLEQALRESKERQAERERSLNDAARKSEAARASLQELIEDHHQTKEAIKTLKLANEEIAAQIDSSRNLITPLEQDLEVNEQELTQLLSLESKERLVSNQAEQNYTQARIAQVRKQEALDALRRQIEVDFGLVAFEYREDISGPTPLPLEGFVEDLPVLTELSEESEKALNRQRSLLRRVGPVNPEAQVEYQEVEERYQFLTTQVNDLQGAAADVQRVIEELDEIMEREFCNTFDAVAEEFHQIFGRLFGGGSARLVLTDPNDLTDTGIDIEARLPGRREQGLSLLSGGERSLTAVALVFALLRVSPTPFCVLDEVDAMLDEANVGRFRELLRELSQSTQFIMITHNRATVQVADIIYGVTMGRDSTSQVLSLKVDELEKVV